MASPDQVQLRRIYDDNGEGDDEAAGQPALRVLVDRLWPRGVRKADAHLDEWLKDAAPSTELRRWYGHDVPRFEEFARRYEAELAEPPASHAVAHLVELARSGPLTLLTATRDVEHSGARVLHEHLVRALAAGDQGGRPDRGADESRHAPPS